MPDRKRTALPRRIEENLEIHIRVASRLREQAETSGGGPAPFVTLSRQYGCEAIALADLLAETLDTTEHLERGSWQVYARKLIEQMADQEYSSSQLLDALGTRARGAIEEFIETLVGQISDLKLLRRLVRTVRATATLGRSIIVGRGGAILTRDMPGGIHIRLVAPEEHRLRGLVERFHWSEAEARKVMHDQDIQRVNFFEKYMDRNPNNPDLYDMILNTAYLSREALAEQIMALYKRRLHP